MEECSHEFPCKRLHLCSAWALKTKQQIKPNTVSKTPIRNSKSKVLFTNAFCFVSRNTVAQEICFLIFGTSSWINRGRNLLKSSDHPEVSSEDSVHRWNVGTGGMGYLGGEDLKSFTWCHYSATEAECKYVEGFWVTKSLQWPLALCGDVGCKRSSKSSSYCCLFFIFSSWNNRTCFCQ